MNTKRFIVASLAVFAFIFVFEWIFHGVFLEPLYAAKPLLWRAKEDCVVWAMFAGQLLFPFIFTYIFIQGYEGKGIGEGVRFGALIGFLFIPANLIYYAVMPLQEILVVYWCAGGVLEMIVCGAIAAAVYKK